MPVLRYLYRVLLGLYAGAQLAFTLVFAPTLFRVLGPVMAAKVVRVLLPMLDGAGVVVAAACLVMALAVDGKPVRREWARVVALVLIIVLTLASLFWLTPQMVHLRVLAGDDITALSPLDPIRQQFGKLHGISATMSLIELLSALVALAFPLLERPRASAAA